VTGTGRTGGWGSRVDDRGSSRKDRGGNVDRVFAALADPRRRELLELLGRSHGCSASSLAAGLPISRQAVAQHLAVLEDSSLVSRKRAGREVLFSVRPEQLAATATWLTDRAAAWTRATAPAGTTVNGTPKIGNIEMTRR
jgi:DNA-binding transcriptional ArsR family regulator